MDIFVRFSPLFPTTRISRATVTATSTTSKAHKARAISSVTGVDLSGARAKRRRGLEREGDELKRALEGVERSPSAGAASLAELIPRPPGRGDFQLRLKMGVSNPLYNEIRAFMRVSIKKFDLDRTAPFRRQRSDEVHKMFMEAAEKYPVLNKFEHNWATAAMIQGCLKNFRGRTRRLALAAETNPSSAGQHDIGGDAGGSVRNDTDTDTGTGGGSDPSGDAAISRPPSRLTFDSDSSGWMSDRWDIDVD